MQTTKAITRVAREAVEDLAQDGWSIPRSGAHQSSTKAQGLSLSEAITAVTDGFAEGERHARDARLNITIHASEPPDLELISVATAFDLDWTKIRQLTVNAIQSGFAPYATRMRVIAEQVDLFFTHL
jgi:adenosine deaminase